MSLEEETNIEGSGNVDSQYLFFYLNEEVYAIKALTTNEIVEYSQITKVPKMASFVKGVTNIRGNIVPVIDLLDRFNLGKSNIGPKSSIIVINYERDESSTQLGVIIDEVYEVDNIPSKDIKNTPEFGSKIYKRFILNMGKYRGEYIPILNTQTILDTKELSQFVE